MKEPQITVGILSGKEIRFSFPETFFCCSGEEVSGLHTVVYKNGKVCWQGMEYDELLFTPLHASANTFFELDSVTIGINFHWERQERQRFRGVLKIVAGKEPTAASPDASVEEKLWAINIIPLEEYLTSVISSEMSATASLELLKAHAVISRSWLLAQLSPIRKNTNLSHPSSLSDTERICWYDREAHTRFDVCADDHCQRYQGITRASTEKVLQAVEATRGKALMYEGKICDARFSKCCGGALEEFQNCWEDTPHGYLIGKRDSLTDDKLPDLTQEEEAAKWIRTSPKAFCNTHDHQVLSQVLNHYDRETTHFYRWKICYRQEELSKLIRKRSGIDFGEITDLIPLERGTSGRIVRLKITGTLRTLIIGKELEIRRILSSSHLYSSAFVVDKEKDDKNGIPTRFTLTGAGWGHGVGLCQIGAAVMGEQGYTYSQILSHYYPGSTLEQLYE